MKNIPGKEKSMEKDFSTDMLQLAKRPTSVAGESE